MDLLIKETVLKEKYKVFASFYQVKLNGGDVLSCRNDLHIFDKEYRSEYDNKSKPKLFMIMMNPGSAEDSHGYYQALFNRTDLLKKITSLPKIPVNFEKDKTLFQVMRLMYFYKIPHTQVINISDYQNTSSTRLSEELDKIHRKDSIHSIFSMEREKELFKILTSLDEKAIIFKAWGQDIVDDCPSFKELVQICNSKLANINQNQIGIRTPKKENKKEQIYYWHPLYQPNNWISAAHKKLGACIY